MTIAAELNITEDAVTLRAVLAQLVPKNIITEKNRYKHSFQYDNLAVYLYTVYGLDDRNQPPRKGSMAKAVVEQRGLLRQQLKRLNIPRESLWQGEEYQGTILGIRFYYKRFYKERRGCKNPSIEIQYWWISHALVTPRD